MAADVRPDPCGGAAPTVTFLYKLARGACPASHGTHVARLAGMPPTVVDRAAGFAARLARCCVSGPCATTPCAST